MRSAMLHTLARISPVVPRAWTRATLSATWLTEKATSATLFQASPRSDAVACRNDSVMPAGKSIERQES